MVKSKTVSIIAILIISMLGGLIISKKALAIPQHYIILPFHTSWENSDRAFGRRDSVDYSKDFSSPKLGYQDTGYGGVTTPSDNYFQGYHFGTRFLVAEGYFGSSYSYGYFNLFDTTPDSDYGPPVKLRPHTFIQLFYYHQGNIADSMIDAQLFNKGTRQFWTLRDFNYNGKYVVDQNGVRLHPACRNNDPQNSWQFALFDLSKVYESDPENWYITKIWIGFDNGGDQKTGFARTYFDMLYISYGTTFVKAQKDPQCPGYLIDADGWIVMSTQLIAWDYGLDTSGYYELELKASIFGFSNATVLKSTSEIPGWVVCDIGPYLFEVQNASTIPYIRVESWPKPTGANLTQYNSTAMSAELVWDCWVLTASALLGPYGLVLDAAYLALKTYATLTTPSGGWSYVWPEVKWTEDGYIYDAPVQAAGEVCIKISHLTEGSYSFPFEFDATFASESTLVGNPDWPTYGLTDILTLPWSTDPDELPVSLSISASSGGTTAPAPGTYTYSYGSSVTVTAIPDSGCTFKWWLLDGATVYGNPITVTMNSDHTLQAYFNRPPNTPSTPSGPTSGYTGTSYSYSTSTTDPDGDNVCYLFYWGDGSFTWTDWYASGATASASHAWDSPGIYYVKVSAGDSYGGSGWSSTLCVKIDEGAGYTLTIEASEDGTTDPPPGTYYYVSGSHVCVEAIPDTGFSFAHWSLDGIYYYENPINVTMNSDHDLTAYFYDNSGGGSGGDPGTCPTLFVWNGSDYVDHGVIDIHNPSGEDVIREVPVSKEDVGISNSKAVFRLREGWPGLNFSESVIDQVKLYVVDSRGNRYLCLLMSAEHSRLGNVLPKLLASDDYKAQLLLLETIDLKFLAPYQNIQSYVFVIEGCNMLKE